MVQTVQCTPVNMTNPLAAACVARVLIVDDEPLLVRGVRRALGCRYEVVGLTSAEDALARITDGERFETILCDLQMADMTGMDLYLALARLAPDQAARVVFMTGGACNDEAQTFLDAVPNGRLAKPFDLLALRALIPD